MADRRRIVTINPFDGTVTTVKDLETGTDFCAVRSTFAVRQGDRRQQLAQSPGRYAGAAVSGETLDNDKVSWQAIVSGSTADVALQNAEAMLLVTESAAQRRYLEWRPEGATGSTYYEIAGPATFELTYEWIVFQGTKSMYVNVEFPVRPLGHGDLASQNIASFTAPGTFTLSTVGGSAPAKADVILSTSGGTSPPVWGMIGWTKTPGTPLSSSVAPWGIIEAENFTSGTNATWAAGLSDATYRGSNGLRCSTSGAGSAYASWTVDPSVMEPDEFSGGTVDIEVWARVFLKTTVASPTMSLALVPFAGQNFGSITYSAEYGSVGKAITVPSADGFRLVRLGTLTMPVDTVQPLKWNVQVSAGWGAASTGTASFGLDYLVMVPARKRCLTRTGVSVSQYQPFVPSTSSTRRLVRSDLSGGLASGSGNFAPVGGVGGSQIILPTGSVDMLVLLSSSVADDPDPAATAMQISHTSVTGQVLVTPRYFLARA